MTLSTLAEITYVLNYDPEFRLEKVGKERLVVNDLEFNLETEDCIYEVKTEVA